MKGYKITTETVRIVSSDVAVSDYVRFLEASGIPAATVRELRTKRIARDSRLETTGPVETTYRIEEIR